MSQVITIQSQTALHIAVINRQWLFVEEILKVMPLEALELKERYYQNTALHQAVWDGNTKAAELMVKKNPKLTQIRDKWGAVPLLLAIKSISSGQKETALYLYSVTRDEDPSPFSGYDGAELLCCTIDANFYDLAMCLVKRFPKLVTEKTRSKVCGIEMMVQRPFAFRSGAKMKGWKSYLYELIQVNMDYSPSCDHGTRGDEENPVERPNNTSNKRTVTEFFGKMVSIFTSVPCLKQLYEQKSMHKQAITLVKCMLIDIETTMTELEIRDFFSNSSVLKTAIKYGIPEFVLECVDKFPFLIRLYIGEQKMIQMAIEERNKTILYLICDRCREDNKINLLSLRDKGNNTILHYAAKLAPSPQLNSVSGAALQMQRELLWYKGVESLVLEQNKFMRNKEGETAQFIFTKEHKKLMEKGEKWMKDTSQSCMLVATLIATVAFAAAFTVPGGNISDKDSRNNGIPVFLDHNSFVVFAVADAFALFSSTTSVLMFLAILTSRYAEEDFLKSLPQKLIIGLATLFISMATILVAFGSALTIVVGHRFSWAPIPITLLGCVPVILFYFLQFPLFYEIVVSTYWSYIFRERRHIIRRSTKKHKKN
ncbi:hypothetical protein MKW98_030337 [Papaver atlanticum]|uniref:PGG domain-containing protein n=1 Tax=Papaver atlanticum TaxID=357466 RepID=A0AAD4TG82_9MAGN|nr:hypothetical protein MKW98_030337 [Papaver atlanticum]